MKKLISTSYAPNSKVLEDLFAPTDFEVSSTKYEKAKSEANGRILTLTRDLNQDNRIDFNDIEWDYLEGNGDFLSHELKELRDEADIIVTNPPFSMFKVFIAWILEANKQFAIIGNMNAITLKDVFPHIRENRIWLGPSISSGDREFRVPDSYPLEAAGWRVDEDGNKFIRVKGVRWFTNIDHGRRHSPLALMSMSENMRFSKHKEVKDAEYSRYVNFDAIEVPFTDAIPGDYSGLMGVPVSFLDKYNPDQFEILGSSGELASPMSQFAEKGSYTQGGPSFYLDIGDGKYSRVYNRIVIRKK